MQGGYSTDVLKELKYCSHLIRFVKCIGFSLKSLKPKKDIICQKKIFLVYSYLQGFNISNNTLY